MVINPELVEFIRDYLSRTQKAVNSYKELAIEYGGEYSDAYRHIYNEYEMCNRVWHILFESNSRQGAWDAMTREEQIWCTWMVNHAKAEHHFTQVGWVNHELEYHQQMQILLAERDKALEEL